MTVKQRSRKPLVYWCRWNNAALRLRGKDADSVWGELAYDDDSAEIFHFNLTTWVLTRGKDNPKIEPLDEMGIVR